jgi:hypothetical protein
MAAKRFSKVCRASVHWLSNPRNSEPRNDSSTHLFGRWKVGKALKSRATSRLRKERKHPNRSPRLTPEEQLMFHPTIVFVEFNPVPTSDPQIHLLYPVMDGGSDPTRPIRLVSGCTSTVMIKGCYRIPQLSVTSLRSKVSSLVR